MNINMPPQDPELTRLLELARTYKMTPEEQFEQRVSWVYGMLGENSSTTKERISATLRAAGYGDATIAPDNGSFAIKLLTIERDNLRAALTAERERADRAEAALAWEKEVSQAHIENHADDLRELRERNARLRDWVERAPHRGGCMHWSTFAQSREAFDEHYRPFGDGECTCGKSAALEGAA